jgi:hypothetical protein
MPRGRVFFPYSTLSFAVVFAGLRGISSLEAKAVFAANQLTACRKWRLEKWL